MSTTAEADAAPSGLRKVVAASMAGTVVEWYEFFLYATAATLVFNKVFFPAVQAGEMTSTTSSRHFSPTRSVSSPAPSVESFSGTSGIGTGASTYCRSRSCWLASPPS